MHNFDLLRESLLLSTYYPYALLTVHPTPCFGTCFECVFLGQSCTVRSKCRGPVAGSCFSLLQTPQRHPARAGAYFGCHSTGYSTFNVQRLKLMVFVGFFVLTYLSPPACGRMARAILCSEGLIYNQTSVAVYSLLSRSPAKVVRKSLIRRRIQ